jgi:hypothetical protein
LRANGFTVIPLPNLLTIVDGLLLVRVTSGRCVDSVVIRAVDCAVAVRVRDRFNPVDPLAEVPAMWTQAGDLVDVAHAVLALPAHGGRTIDPRHRRERPSCS